MDSSGTAPPTFVSGLPALREIVEAPLPPSRWLDVDRELLAGFDRATRHSPSTNYRGPETSAAAHATHSLALLLAQWDVTVAVTDIGDTITYGFDRVRFPAPMEPGARVRAHFRILAVEDVADMVQCTVDATLEAAGRAKPVCVARVTLRLSTSKEPA